MRQLIYHPRTVHPTPLYHTSCVANPPPPHSSLGLPWTPMLTHLPLPALLSQPLNPVVVGMGKARIDMRIRGRRLRIPAAGGRHAPGVVLSIVIKRVPVLRPE